MTNPESKFRFRKFPVYCDARIFNQEIRKMVQTSFPPEEKFGLSAQISRASISIILNIAEGSNRGTDRDFAHFLNTAHTSIDEVVACCDIGLDNGYIEKDEHERLLAMSTLLANQLTAFRNQVLKDSSKISKSNVKGQLSNVA